MCVSCLAVQWKSHIWYIRSTDISDHRLLSYSVEDKSRETGGDLKALFGKISSFFSFLFLPLSSSLSDCDVLPLEEVVEEEAEETCYALFRFRAGHESRKGSLSDLCLLKRPEVVFPETLILLLECLVLVLVQLLVAINDRKRLTGISTFKICEPVSFLRSGFPLLTRTRRGVDVIERAVRGLQVPAAKVHAELLVCTILSDGSGDELRVCAPHVWGKQIGAHAR